ARRLPTISSLIAGEREAGERAIEFLARRYEADSQLHVNNCVYLDWLEEAIETALGAEALATRWPRYYHIEYLRPIWPGDRVRLTTRWLWRTRHRLLVEQEIA